MPALPPFAQNLLRAALGAGLNKITVQVSTIAPGADAWSAVPLSVVVTADSSGQRHDEESGNIKRERTIIVRPLADMLIRRGDKIAYDSEDFTVTDCSGTDIRRITATTSKSMGVGRADRARAEGG